MTKISVVVLTKNSQKHINKCLLSIINQKYNDFEIIVIDAESKDQTLDILYLRFIKKIKLISVPSDTSIGKARQVGVDNSQGEIIAFIDSDVELPHENWLKNMSEPIMHLSYAINKKIAGTQTLSKCRDTDPWILKHLHNSFEYKNKVIGKDNYEMIGTGHCLIGKKYITEVGGFRDINSFEDLDMTRKIVENGLVFVYLPEEKVYHYHVDNLWHYIKKHMIRNKINAIRRILFE